MELVTYCAYRKHEIGFVHSGSLAHVEEMISYISEHLEEKLDADRIARRFLLSRPYVQNFFLQNMHIWLKKYIMQKKIYAAHVDLLRGVRLNRVCEKYKFGDYSLFYRTYKKTFGNSQREIK